MIPPAVEIVQDGNRALWISGRASLRSLIGGGLITKDLDLGDEVRTGALAVRYRDDALGLVDDWELDEEDRSVFLAAQLDKRQRYVAMIRDLIERKALTLDPHVAAKLGIRIKSGLVDRLPLSDVGLVHRGIQMAAPVEAFAALKALRTPLSPDAHRELERAVLLEERQAYMAAAARGK